MQKGDIRDIGQFKLTLLYLVLLASISNVAFASVQGDCDQFETLNLFPAPEQGRVYTSTWHTHNRTLSAVEYDPYDNEAEVRGSGELEVDAATGIANMVGDPRYYVYDRSDVQTWGDFEATVYAMRVEEEDPMQSYSGFTIFGRSSHNLYHDEPCQALGYYFRYYYSTGQFSFQKEFYHGDSTYYSASRRISSMYATVPYNVWFGFKFVVQTMYDGGGDPFGVRLQAYWDLTDGLNGGNWTLVHETEDVGGWNSINPVPSECGYAEDEIVYRPGAVVALRTDSVVSLLWKKWGVREIDASVTQPSCTDGDCECSSSGSSSPPPNLLLHVVFVLISLLLAIIHLG